MENFKSDIDEQKQKHFMDNSNVDKSGIDQFHSFTFNPNEDVNLNQNKSLLELTKDNIKTPFLDSDLMNNSLSNTHQEIDQ